MTASRATQASVAERRTKLIQMRLAGHSFDECATRLGYSSRSAATKDFTRVFEQVTVEQRASAEVYREVELARLDDLTVTATRVLLTKHYVTTQGGRLVEHPETGLPLLDDGPVLQAIDRLLKIQDRRAKLLGLDSPQRVEVLTIDAIDRAIADLNGQLAAFDDQAGEAATAPESAG
jgi:hypothetical protein